VTTPLYEKRGRRYYLWGNGEHWDTQTDAMQAGTCRLVYCPEPGFYRYRYDVTLDTAAFLAAAEVARHAMEEAMHEKARSATAMSQAVPWTPEQKRLIQQFERDMNATGAFLPTHWLQSTPRDIAQAGIDAVRRVYEETAGRGEGD
jgi:hypothetical protein